MTYDIKDLFVNMSVNEVTGIIKNTFPGPPDVQIMTQIIELTKTVLSQNYLCFKIKYTIQTKE